MDSSAHAGKECKYFGLDLESQNMAQTYEFAYMGLIEYAKQAIGTFQ